MNPCILIVLVTFAWPRSTIGFSGRFRSNCNVQKICTEPYEARVEASDSELKMCASLTLYQRCLYRRKSSCRSHIYYNTLRSLIPVFMKEYKCNNITLPNTEAEILSIFHNSASIIPLEPKPTHKPKCKATIRGNTFRNISSSDKRYCGLFGDPHLRTFYDSKQTCVVEGAWPLIDNEFLIVQVTNVPLVDGFSATATNKITIIVKEDKNNCVEQKIYQAKSGVLPVEFSDGSSVTGTSSCKVKVMELVKDSLIQIKLCHIGTDILVRKVSQFLTFHIRMPRQIANLWRSQGLCISGCPQREIIDYRELLSYTESQLATALPKSKVTRREAKQKCEDSNLKGFYLDSCVFDLLTTGDQNFTFAAKSALDDAFLMDPFGTVKDISTYNVTVNINPDMNLTETHPKSKHSGAATARSSVAMTQVLFLAVFSIFLLQNTGSC